MNLKYMLCLALLVTGYVRAMERGTDNDVIADQQRAEKFSIARQLLANEQLLQENAKKIIENGKKIQGQTWILELEQICRQTNLLLNQLPTTTRGQIVDIIRKLLVNEKKLLDSSQKIMTSGNNSDQVQQILENTSKLISKVRMAYTYQLFRFWLYPLGLALFARAIFEIYGIHK